MCEVGLLPRGYRQVSQIYVPVGAYATLLQTHSRQITYFLDATFYDNSSLLNGDNILIGSPTNYRPIILEMSRGQFVFAYNTFKRLTPVVGYSTRLEIEFGVENGSQYIMANNELIGTGNITATVDFSVNRITLFRATGQGYYFNGLFGGGKAYADGGLYFRLIPCVNPNNIVGLYDTVRRVFYGSGNQNIPFEEVLGA